VWWVLSPGSPTARGWVVLSWWQWWLWWLWWQQSPRAVSPGRQEWGSPWHPPASERCQLMVPPRVPSMGTSGQGVCWGSGEGRRREDEGGWQSPLTPCTPPAGSRSSSTRRTRAWTCCWSISPSPSAPSRMSPPVPVPQGRGAPGAQRGWGGGPGGCSSLSLE